MTRAVSWGGLHNARDLGGLPRTAPGGSPRTRFGQIYRSGRLDALAGTGWAEVAAAGVSTIVDLRNASEVRELPHRPTTVTTRALPIEDENDVEFMTRWHGRLGSPHYYAVAVGRWPDLFRAAFAAIAGAPDGGVIVNCSAGRDRTGLVSALLLDEAGVERGAILDDYEVAARATNARLRTHPVPHETAVDEITLGQRIRAAREALDRFLDTADRSPFGTELAGAASRLL